MENATSGIKINKELYSEHTLLDMSLHKFQARGFRGQLEVLKF